MWKTEHRGLGAEGKLCALVVGCGVYTMEPLSKLRCDVVVKAFKRRCHQHPKTL